MNMLKLELKKYMTSPAILVYLLLCLGLNMMIIFSDYSSDQGDFLRYLGNSTETTGITMDEDYRAALDQLDDEEYRDILIAGYDDSETVFDTYHTGELYEAYADSLGFGGLTAELLERKYELLQNSVDTLAREQADMDLYAASLTPDLHANLFFILLRLIVGEGIMLALIVTLTVICHENGQHTDQIIYSSRKGTGVMKTKLLTSILLSVAAFALLLLLTLLFYFIRWDYSGIWHSSVSSQFNYLYDYIVIKPFITWVPLTVSQYLAAVFALSLLLLIVFCLLAGVVGMITQDAFRGFIFCLVLAGLMMCLPSFFRSAGLDLLYFVSNLSPVILWYQQGQWFTDFGYSSLLPFHETIGTLLNLLLLGGAFGLMYRQFKRKDICS